MKAWYENFAKFGYSIPMKLYDHGIFCITCVVRITNYNYNDVN
jgi:hypothetical protein